MKIWRDLPLQEYAEQLAIAQQPVQKYLPLNDKSTDCSQRRMRRILMSEEEPLRDTIRRGVITGEAATVSFSKEIPGLG